MGKLRDLEKEVREMVEWLHKKTFELYILQELNRPKEVMENVILPKEEYDMGIRLNISVEDYENFVKKLNEQDERKIMNNLVSEFYKYVSINV